jgi:hypothetical protein
MARTCLNNNYGFPLDRGVITPRPAGLTEEQYLIHALKEGYKLLEADAKPPHPNAFGQPPNPKASAKSDSVKPEPSKVQDALALKSKNPYERAQAMLLSQMLPAARSVMDKMIAGTLTRDVRYDTFIREVTALGDKLSNIKP